jgi:protoheme IX farnesyltransferase
VHSLIEYSHRLSASVVGFLVLSLAVVAWLKFRSVKAIFWPAFGTLIVLGFEAWVGKAVVEGDLPKNLVALHLLAALTLVALAVVVCVNAFYTRGGRRGPLAAEALWVAVIVFAALMLGALVSQSRAALAFPDWPLFDGRLFPEIWRGHALIHYLHRIAALTSGVALAHLSRRVVKERAARPVTILAHSAFGLWVLQVAIGAANVFAKSATWAVVGHVATGALLWAVIVAATGVAYRLSPHSQPRSGGSSSPVKAGVAATIKAYFMLTKPRIIELLLITTLPAMMVAARGWPRLGLALATLLGGSMTAGAANSINCYFDRDIDERMERTAGRPLPSKQVAPGRALVFGIVLGIVGTVWLDLVVNPAAAAFAGGAILFYVFVYTMWLKRTTPSNIVIGGAAGAAPVLVGWAAVRGGVGLPALVMFAVVFYWTPPHFWALSLRYSDDYRAAGVPMLPVVRGAGETTRQIVLYSWLLLATSLLFFPAAHAGTVYLALAIGSGALFVFYAYKLRSAPGDRAAMWFFRYSITYLTVLFAGMGIDQVVRVPAPPPSVYPIVLGIAALVFLGATPWILASAMDPSRWHAP